MPLTCHKCSTNIPLIDSKVARKEECPSCKSDLHVCYNCKFYDPKAYNECAETQAERVLDKDRSNYCDYFVVATEGKKNTNTSQEALKKLDDLFK